MENQSTIFEDSPTSWTQYQKLVLAELKRHDEKQESLQLQAINLQLSLAELKIQLANNNTAITSLLSEIKNLHQARENQNLSLKAIQWKITTFSAGAASAITVLIQILLKVFGK